MNISSKGEDSSTNSLFSEVRNTKNFFKNVRLPSEKIKYPKLTSDEKSLLLNALDKIPNTLTISYNSHCHPAQSDRYTKKLSRETIRKAITTNRNENNDYRIIDGLCLVVGLNDNLAILDADSEESSSKVKNILEENGIKTSCWYSTPGHLSTVIKISETEKRYFASKGVTSFKCCDGKFEIKLLGTSNVVGRKHKSKTVDINGINYKQDLYQKYNFIGNGSFENMIPKLVKEGTLIELYKESENYGKENQDSKNENEYNYNKLNTTIYEYINNSDNPIEVVIDILENVYGLEEVRKISNYVYCKNPFHESRTESHKSMYFTLKEVVFWTDTKSETGRVGNDLVSLGYYLNESKKGHSIDKIDNTEKDSTFYKVKKEYGQKICNYLGIEIPQEETKKRTTFKTKVKNYISEKDTSSNTVEESKVNEYHQVSNRNQFTTKYLGNNKVTALHLPKNSGKTTKVLERIVELEKEESQGYNLVLSHRVALNEETANKLRKKGVKNVYTSKDLEKKNIVNLVNQKIQAKESMTLIICIDSLHKLIGLDHVPKFMFIDEFNALVDAVYWSKTAITENRFTCKQVLERFFKCCNETIIASSDLDMLDIDYLYKCTICPVDINYVTGKYITNNAEVTLFHGQKDKQKLIAYTTKIFEKVAHTIKNRNIEASKVYEMFKQIVANLKGNVSLLIEISELFSNILTSIKKEFPFKRTAIPVESVRLSEQLDKLYFKTLVKVLGKDNVPLNQDTLLRHTKEDTLYHLLRVNSNTTQTDVIRESSKDYTDFIYKNEIAIIIYTPAISTGNSIENEFDEVIFFQNNTQLYKDALQQIGRIRNSKQTLIHIATLDDESKQSLTEQDFSDNLFRPLEFTKNNKFYNEFLKENREKQYKEHKLNSYNEKLRYDDNLFSIDSYQFSREDAENSTDFKYFRKRSLKVSKEYDNNVRLFIQTLDDEYETLIVSGEKISSVKDSDIKKVKQDLDEVNEDIDKNKSSVIVKAFTETHNELFNFNVDYSKHSLTNDCRKQRLDEYILNMKTELNLNKPPKKSECSGEYDYLFKTAKYLYAKYPHLPQTLDFAERCIVKDKNWMKRVKLCFFSQYLDKAVEHDYKQRFNEPVDINRITPKALMLRQIGFIDNKGITVKHWYDKNDHRINKIRNKAISYGEDFKRIMGFGLQKDPTSFINILFKQIGRSTIKKKNQNKYSYKVEEFIDTDLNVYDSPDVREKKKDSYNLMMYYWSFYSCLKTAYNVCEGDSVKLPLQPIYKVGDNLDNQIYHEPVSADIH